MNPLVSQYARIVAELRERIKAEHSLDDGDEALETTLEGVTQLPELLAAMARRVALLEKQSEGIAKLVEDYLRRADRLEHQADRLRDQIAWALSEAGVKRIPVDALPEMTAAVSIGRAPLVIPNEMTVPDEYRRYKTTSEPNKAAIRDALEAGARFEWAMLGNAKPTLRLTSK